MRTQETRVCRFVGQHSDRRKPLIDRFLVILGKLAASSANIPYTLLVCQELDGGRLKERTGSQIEQSSSVLIPSKWNTSSMHCKAAEMSRTIRPLVS